MLEKDQYYAQLEHEKRGANTTSNYHGNAFHHVEHF
jgi:hypothetical protein